MRRKSLTAMFVAVATLLPTLARAETTEIRCQDIEDPTEQCLRIIALSQAHPYLATTLHSQPDLGARFGCGPRRLGAFQSLFFDAAGHA